MTIVSSLLQRRRYLLLGVLTLALHYVTIDWVGTRIGAQRSHQAQAEPSLITAQLHLALPPRAATASAPPPQIAPLAPSRVPHIHAAPPPRPAPPPAADTSLADAADPALASVPDLAPPADAASASAASAAAASAASAAASTPATPPTPAASAADTAASGPAVAPPPPAQPATGARRYKVNLPPSADFTLDVHRVDANGSTYNGEASMSWRSDGSRYKVTVDAGISIVIRINLLALTSTGTIDDYGIAPDLSTEKRAGHAQTATHFNRDDGSISFSASEARYPLLAGAQDKATVPFQLGGIGRANINQFSGDIDMMVGDDKTAAIFRFQLVGEEELDTKMGRIVTLHLTRPPMPGSYSSRLDIWLAPGRNWYPIQIRNTEASGALTTQTVSNITVIDNRN